LSLLTAGFAYTLFEHAGLEPFAWHVSFFVLGLAALVCWLFAPRFGGVSAMRPVLGWSLLLLPCYVGLQLIPVPLWLLRFASPIRAQIVESLGALSGGLSVAPLSINFSSTFDHLFRILACTLTFLLVREVTARSARRQWPWMTAAPLILLGGLEAGLGFLQRAEGVDVQGTYGSKDHFAGILEMVLPLAAAYGCALFNRGEERRGPSTRDTMTGCVAFSIATAVFAAIAFSLSKMGFVACIGGLLVMGALGLSTGKLIWKKTAIVGLFVLGLLVFVWLPPPELVRSFGSLENDPTAEGRLPVWRDTVKLMRDYPVFGSGLGTYDSAFQRYQSSSVDVAFAFAHNDYLQAASELGAAGFAIAAVLMISILGRAWRAAKRTSDVNIRFLGAGCAGGMAAIFLHSLADFNLYIPANALTLAWICGMAAGLPLGSRPIFSGEPARTAIGRLASVRTSALALGLLLMLYAPVWILFDTAFKSDPEAEKRFCRFGICDTDSVVSAQAILYRGGVAAIPMPILQEALIRDANSADRWCDTGEAMVRLGDLKKADACFSNALTLGRNDPPVLLRLADYFFELHRDGKALELSARILGLTDSYDDAVFALYRKNKIAVPEILVSGLPHTPRADEAYVHSVLDTGRVRDAMVSWQVVNARAHADGLLANQYVEFLLRNQQPEMAAQAWAHYSGPRGAGYLQSTWLYNGDFELDPSGSAFDWRIDPIAGVEAAPDETIAHSGKRSLRIEFDGQSNVDFHHIAQLASVSQGTYTFEAYVKTDHLTTDQGISFRIFDPEAGGRLDVKTEQMNGTNDWTKVEQSFCVPRPTKLVEVQAIRPASWKFDNKISGTAWIDSVSLSKADGSCGGRGIMTSTASP